MKRGENEVYQFYKFINEIKSNCQYYDRLDVKNYYENYYNEYPCSSKKDLLKNYKYCVNSEIIDPNDRTMFENIMAVNDLSRNHDKKIIINGENVHVETTSGTTGKPLPILKTDKIRLQEGRHLMKCRKYIEKNANFENGFMIIHNSDKKVTDLDIRNDKHKFKDYDKLLEYFWKKDPIWSFSTVLIAKRFFEYIEQNVGFEEFRYRSNLKFFETTSQSFNEREKAFYSEKLNTKLVNNYGCREVWNIAYECSCGSLHVNNSYLLVSVVDENNCIIEEDGVVGKVIISSLINHLFPIVKYFIGDYARIYRNHECKCGLRTPILVLEKGRPFEKIKYSEFYGNDIFKRVLRGLYFHEGIQNFDDIKIVQKDKVFEIFVKGELTNIFMDEFVHITEFLLQSRIFKFKFFKVSSFDFLGMKNEDKDFLFKNIY